MQLDSPIQYLKGVGPVMAKKLVKLEVHTVNDLINYFPRVWLDLSIESDLRHAKIGDSVVVLGEVDSVTTTKSFKKHMAVVKAKILTERGEGITAVWYNQPFLKNILSVGSKYIYYGKIDYDWKLKEKILQSPILEKKFSILAIYPETDGVNSKYLRKLVKEIFDSPISLIEFLPNDIITGNNLMSFNDAVREIHCPTSILHLDRAKYRLAFNEVFLIVAKVLFAKRNNLLLGSYSMKFNNVIMQRFVKSLPYKLTNAQRKSSWEIIKDMNKNYPMNRLLNGDVGSGKTIVAQLSALNCVVNNYQVAWMAPTEILANQHYNTTCKLLKDFDIKITLITSNKVTSNMEENSKLKTQSSKLQPKAKELKSHSSRLGEAGEVNKLISNSDIVIGTHSLIQEGVSFPNLGLVIIDEQHRFGVKQRAALQSKKLSASNKLKSLNLVPHFLSMTATPIPRSLALSVYGDLDISVLDEMPAGRKQIVTRVAEPINVNKEYQFIRDQINSGRQIFVICPLIEPSTKKIESISLFDQDKKSVKSEFDKLSKVIFPDFKVGCLHGKMKSSEKDQIMDDFKNKKIDLLVSTSVIEVGIDIPNASVMMIEDADKFGLAQLHQFRGRVGRGEHQSYCILFTNSRSPLTNKRLQVLVECSDGFKLAQKDLELRGPGELIGTDQSGQYDLKFASLTDIMLIRKIRLICEKIINDKSGDYLELINKLKDFSTHNHFE
jgi:ATP-dependent DNA helicase RecG